ncbi:uncharacterized protein MELLADRAFT_109881 [Melampsora larici-populina 98AG31]|uniref:Uncharacterized protein n=1 Tax=Melampsora larici-populina (strain 98AG31 / pathotype 3-4-7) TaxID=747676 RepID=F4RXY1_MELLP|nr:uncharacterized protein MELLADRAFT_109881 [Melampsora larici-populina 98AG31]EGG02811.1 hypothetical protein MELLADRAFT_109881 [Melampsora larici-populina 98AG31]
MTSQTTSSYSGLTLQMVRETNEDTGLTGSTPYVHPLDCTRNCVFCSDDSRSVIEEIAGVDHIPRDSNEVLESPFECEPSTSRTTRMAGNTDNEEPEDFAEEMMLDASMIPIFDSCGCEPTKEKTLSSTDLSGQALEEYDEDQPFDISSRPSFVTFETSHDVDPFSDSYISPFSIPRSMIDWQRDEYIDASTIPAFVEFTVTNPVYTDYQFNPSMRSQGVGGSRQEVEPCKDEDSVSDHDTESSEWTSTADSNTDYPGCESSDSGSGDEKTMDIKGKSKAVKNMGRKLFLPQKTRRKVVPLPKATWKSSIDDIETSSIEGEEADVDEPGSSSQNQSDKKRRRLSSIEALVLKLPNTTLKIFPTMVVYDSQVDRPGMARSRLSLKRPLSDERSDDFFFMELNIPDDKLLNSNDQDFLIYALCTHKRHLNYMGIFRSESLVMSNLQTVLFYRFMLQSETMVFTPRHVEIATPPFLFLDRPIAYLVVLLTSVQISVSQRRRVLQILCREGNGNHYNTFKNV